MKLSHVKFDDVFLEKLRRFKLMHFSKCQCSPFPSLRTAGANLSVFVWQPIKAAL